MAYIDLCKPCAEALRAEGKSVIFVSGGRDHKVFCDHCGRRRFGALYNVDSAHQKVRAHVARHA